MINFLLANPLSAHPKKKKNKGVPELTEKQVIELKNNFFEANKEKMLGNNEKAILLFKKCISIDPQHAASYYELALLLTNAHKITEATDLMIKARDLDPGNKWYQQGLAVLYETQKQYDLGAETYEELIKQHPNELAYYEVLANMYLYQNDLKSAIRVYNRTEEQFGVLEFTSTQKQKIYVSQRKYDRAIEEAQKLIDRYPNTNRYYTALAKLYTQNGQKAEAIETYQKLLEIDPNNSFVQLSMATYYYEGGEIEKGKATMKKAFSNPDLDFNSKARILFSQVAYNNVPDGQVNPFGIELAQIMVETHPKDPKSWAVQADLLFQNGDNNGALEAYNKSLELEPNQFLVWSQTFILHSENNNWQEVFEGTEKALEYFPSQPTIYYFRGIAALQLKKYQDGVDALETGKDFVIDNNNLLGQFYTNLGDGYHNLNKHQLSDSYFEKALKINPNDILVLNNYSYYLSIRGENLDKAAEMSKKTVDSQPNSSTYLDTYAWVLYKKGDYEEAKKWMSMAMENDGDKEGVIVEHYGDILFKLNETEAAINYWLKAKELGGGSNLLEKKIDSKRLHE
ncbi:MAG: hypothetical protein CL840_09600 [Crocinitomicaceae bacterium]|nr:hypothetical protein [Crocinitomicaceae bacterium]|tara:strand:+ start:908 stop:2614 length:1707 start_codon:yes stop_codon:yes gene_type:complete